MQNQQDRVTLRTWSARRSGATIRIRYRDTDGLLKTISGIDSISSGHDGGKPVAYGLDGKTYELV